ncbi:MAG: GntR family transcriptional regulator [Mesorhizobium sp.]|nr:GntR family transcriptional regulator [Mesorhizobium sp.]MBL8577848.1 GntR family transcriptional regulator [Mesorhizobium sp.]
MQTVPKRPRSNHLDLAQRILDAVRQGGFRLGDRLPEQQVATLCNVSRTPVRAALHLLSEQGVVVWEKATGFTLAVDPAATLGAAAELPSADEDRLADSILRDRAARRLDGTVTAAGLSRRYRKEKRTVLKSLKILEAENWLEKAPGQSWLFRPAQEGPEAIAESYDYRLLLEPASLLEPGFRADETQSSALRLGMEAQLASPESAFDIREFQRLDLAFHGMVARGAANRFVGQSLADHLRLRRLPGMLHGVNVFRLKQSTREHLAILDQIEAGQFEAAADLMRLHLRLSRSQRPQAASRGAPVLPAAAERRGR